MTPVATQEKTIVVGLGELHVTRDADATLVCLGLGSCIALCAYDPVSRVAGMAHLVLPDSREGRDARRSAKFVDIGVPLLLEEMERLGAMRSRLILKIVGGAHMISSPSPNGVLNIGDRNAEAVRALLSSLGLPLQAADTGGNRGRTARLSVATGQLTVSTAGVSSYEL